MFLFCCCCLFKLDKLAKEFKWQLIYHQEKPTVKSIPAKKKKKKEYRIPTNGQGMIRLNVIRSKNMNDDEL